MQKCVGMKINDGYQIFHANTRVKEAQLIRNINCYLVQNFIFCGRIVKTHDLNLLGWVQLHQVGIGPIALIKLKLKTIKLNI